MKYSYSVLLLACTAIFSSCGPENPAAQSSVKKLLDPANMDTTVRPGENFFYYANGAWLKTNPIPKSETSWGSFYELDQNTRKQLRTLLDEASKLKNVEKGSAAQMVRDLYRSGMDSSKIAQEGIKPIQQYLDAIDQVQSTEALMKLNAEMYTKGMGTLYTFYVFADDKNVSKNIAQFYQGGLGMPDRDYYFNTDERTTKIREAYKKYLVNIFKLSGQEESVAEKSAQDVFALETKLAESQMTLVEQRDPYKVYNKYDRASLQKLTPNFDWNLIFDAMKIGKEDSCLVGMPKYFAAISRQIKETPLDVWKNYFRFHLVSDMAAYLSPEFDQAQFEFYGKTIRGQEEPKPRWYRVLGMVNNLTGELLGQMYVDKYFKPEAKKRMLELVDNLQETYAERIQRLDWMSDATKQKALAKLNTFLKKIGYPDKWKDYSQLEISDESYVQNIINASAFEYDRIINKLGKPIDKTEWMMSPPTVNAYYNPAYNEIVFPAGILQYPFFDFNADDALNYGGIGAVIGHEMTHGFDDQGRQFDADGNLNDWWMPEDAERFNKLAQKVVAQYNAYKVLDSISVNGSLTLGENLADLGGLAIAYEAFMKTEQAKNGEKIDGFTPEQRFFLSWAQIWRANIRPEEQVSRIMTDPHSPNVWRCNGPLSNLDAFYQAFDVKEGDAMYRPDSARIQVW